ncbi:MAG: formylglycine-generating enzyme family protein [Phaeodactylibacter xiamenensis]|uniref:formylglycine-generating enzyme family protein n=1 Tax=Phaeodactylibacter xiamenensis TaxID=1524460 RepID=UPI000695D2FF|nr:formylglycine-generating enzyme family protein [Phaeodactylibacter xiamenensis]MCR9053799.1 formylglycine-generating enzyme family protein [bacterium]
MTTTSTQNKSDYDVLLPGGTKIEMVEVEGGTFMMGSEEREREKPIHEVKVPNFHIGKHPVTQEQWVAVMGDNPARFRGRAHPVDRVRWHDTQAFLKKLNQLVNEAFRLPSEAEWEYAARGGKYNQGLQYAGSKKLKEVGWYDENSNGQTQPVGLKLPNELGIFDMSGNVWERCADHWHENYEGAPVDGSAWITGGEKHRRVVRGGSWDDYDGSCRPSLRYWYLTNNRNFNIGFRLARY